MQRPATARRKALDEFTDKSGGPDACWPWTGKTNGGGYGVLPSGELAHVESWSEDRSEDPGDLFICHSCDNRPCINPRHLAQNTAKGNTRDAMRKGRHVMPPDARAARRMEAIQRRQVRRDEWADAHEIEVDDLRGISEHCSAMKSNAV